MPLLMLVLTGRKGLMQCLRTGLQSSLVTQGLKMDEKKEKDEKAKNISSKRNESGGFILPPMSDYHKIRQKQRVVQAYVGAVYSKSLDPIFLTHLLKDITGDFTGSSTSSFPYSLSAKDDQSIFSPECVPDGFCLSNPDHLTMAQINHLYIHWMKRQAEGLAPLIILNASPLHEGHSRSQQKARPRPRFTHGLM